MGLENLINPDLNVKNLVELSPKNEIDPWELYSKKDIEENFGDTWQNVIFSGIDISTFENKDSYIDIYKNLIAKIPFSDSNSRYNSEIDNIKIEKYLMYQSSIRLLTGDIGKDNSNLRRKQMGLRRIEKIYEKSAEDFFGYDEFDHIFNFKINYPSFDVGSIIHTIHSKIPDFINDLVNDYSSIILNTLLIKRLRALSIIKLISPELIKEYDLVNSELFNNSKSGAKAYMEREVKDYKMAINISSYLKFLSASNAYLGKFGIVLEGINNFKIDPDTPLPERRKF